MQKLKQQVFEANMDLPRYGLVTFTWGNVGAILGGDHRGGGGRDGHHGSGAAAG